MIPFSLPSRYARIKRVRSFEELVTTRFEDGVNALCWERELPGNFAEVVNGLGGGTGLGVGITTLEEERLRELSASVSDAGRMAIRVMLEDLRRLRECGMEPVLDAVNGYEPKEQPGPVRTDVCSFHADSATAETDTYLCTYHGASSEGLRNEEAVRRVEVLETRAKLWEMWKAEEQGRERERERGQEQDQDQGQEEEGFREWLSENCFDLHYAAAAGARPFSFGVGNLWRIAVEWPGCAVPPCIHRAPEPGGGVGRIGDAEMGRRGAGDSGMAGVRLLLIS